jgi:spermidine/putrescine transport system permease protein
MDLGATPVTAFFKVTLPLLFPGILAGFLLAFALSMDDFVISQFTQGPATMFPTWVFGSTRVGIPPHVFAFATIIFVTGATLALALAFTQRRRT